MTFLGHEDPQPTHIPDPSAPPQDPFVDDPVARYLGSVPVQRRGSRRRTAVIVVAAAALVVLVGGGSAIAALTEGPERGGRAGAPLAAQTSVSPPSPGVQSPVPAPSVPVTTPRAPRTGVPATAAPAAQVPVTAPPAPASSQPNPDEPSWSPSARPTHDGTVRLGDPCPVSEIGWIGYSEQGARLVCGRVGLQRPHWVPVR